VAKEFSGTHMKSDLRVETATLNYINVILAAAKGLVRGLSSGTK
jgi:hypothetical protein